MGTTILYPNENSHQKKTISQQFPADNASTNNWVFADPDTLIRANTPIPMRISMTHRLIKNAICFDV